MGGGEQRWGGVVLEGLDYVWGEDVISLSSERVPLQMGDSLVLHQPIPRIA